MVSYHDLSALNNAELKEMLTLAGQQPSSNYNRNRSMLAAVLAKYNGDVDADAIKNFLKPSKNTKKEGRLRLHASAKPSKKAAAQKVAAQEEEPDIMNIQPDLYTKTSVPREVRREMYDAIHSIQPDLYTKKARSHEERKASFDRIAPAFNQLKRAKDVIKSINNKPLKNEKWTTAKKDRVKENERRIEFDIKSLNDENKEYFHKHIAAVFLALLGKINTIQQWICGYSFDGSKSNHSTLNETRAGELIHQMKNENYITEAEAEHSKVQERDYDFFQTEIKNLTHIIFYDVTAYPNLQMSDIRKGNVAQKDEYDDDAVYQALVASGAPEEVINQYKETKRKATKKQYKTRDGKFWKYTVNIPVDLERYQIFNTVDKRTADLMTKDNCLIYACIQSGLPESLIDRMREIIRVRAFPQSKLQEIAEDLYVTFRVTVVGESNGKTESRVKVYEPRRHVSEYTVPLLLIDGHYMVNEKVKITTFFIEHYEEICEKLGDIINTPAGLIRAQRTYRFVEGRCKVDNNRETPLLNIIKALFKNNRFIPIVIGDVVTYSSLIYKEKLDELTSLDYDEKRCCRLKEKVDKQVKYDKNGKEKKEKARFTREHVVYADFECSTDGVHKAFAICYESNDGCLKGSFWGANCAEMFLETLESNTLVYYHNLSYDINFILNKLTAVKGTPIIKGTRTMSIEGVYKNKVLQFKDSYAIISKKLKMFPEMFHLKTGPKEVFPYQYYSSTLLAGGNKVGVISEAVHYVKEPEVFLHNINTVQRCRIDDNHFDLEVYSNYYCEQDVRILKEGFERFRQDLLTAFDLDAYDFVSICSIANRYFEENVYYKNGNLFDLANKPRQFISRCIQGGRCMLADNEKQINEDVDEKIVDFDAVSLYPSAIARLYTLEGKPKVIPEKMCNADYLLKHLFTDDQTEPTQDRFISAFYVEARIKSIGVERHFPSIVVDPSYNAELDKVPRSSNTCCTMYINHISLQDLITFQDCDIEVVRGYYYDGTRDLTIRNEVKKLFELRLRYKKEGNPLQEVIKLILNSIYGKTILKPIETKYRFVKDSEAMRFLRKNYNSIVSFEPLYDSNTTVFKQLKPIVRHYNFCPLGVDILAMSKRIMNEVFCTAEDNGMKIYYQDTDSGHYNEKDISVLGDLFRKKYGRELIGKALGQFHSDFAEVTKGHESKALRSIFVGKKTYLDELSNDTGAIAFHCRMKGVTQSVIAIKANELFPDTVQVDYDEGSGLFRPVGAYDIDSRFSVYELYKKLYAGDAVEFDLCAGDNVCFDCRRNYSITTKQHFIRRLAF